MIQHTKDINDEFFPELERVAEDVQAKSIHLLSVMNSESGVSAKAHNRNGNASGILQFMPATLARLGWKSGHEAFRQLNATEQLSFVRKYFLPYKAKLSEPNLGSSVGAVYVATFLPALLDHAHEPDFVLTAKGGPLGWAYAPNAVFDRNKDLAITVLELEEAVARNCRGPRWAEIVARLSGYPFIDGVSDDEFDLRTTLGVQRALARLGFDVGPIDGIPGSRTRAAVLAFQREVPSLVADGIYGPKTRAALEIALKTYA